MKKLSAVLALLALLTQTFIPVAQAVSTNSQSSPWTVEKAEHLARKVYFSATPANIAELYQAGSAAAAANIVFSNTTGPDRTQYDAEILALTSSGFNWSDGGHMNRLYQYRYARDPYESKAKLFSLFEDIFPVNQSDRISHRDILDQHDLIYSNMLGNYRNLLKRQMHNPGGRGDFAMGQFLDLLDQTDSRNPNENYARELVQLFMMGDYKPGESKELGNDRNYEDRDVQALARILTGYVADPTTKVVSYDASKHNTSTGVLFLSGGTANFPFVNSSGALDLALMATPIAGNAGLSDNTIDYIFAMREEAISLFLADRLYRFYIYERPTRAELDTIAAQIRANNFEILPVVRYILSSDVMYSDKSMNGLLYKNPLELTIGTIKLLHRNSPSSIDSMLRDTNLLSRFNWSPYFPGSVFGRDGFDDNAKFYSSYIQNQWMSYTSRIAFDSTAGSYSLSEVIPSTSTGVVSAIQVATSSGNTFSGSLQISSASLYLTQTGATASGASQTGAIGPELLTLTGGSINLPSFQLTTSRGVVQFDDALLDPMTSQLTLSSGRIQSGSGWYTLTGSMTFSTASITRELLPREVISQIESSLLLSRRLPTTVVDDISTFLTTSSTGALQVFRPSTQPNKLRSAIAMVLAQPEYILQTGIDRPIVTENTAQSVLANATGKLLFVELGGGYDWLHGVVPKNEFQTYTNKRTNTSGTIGISQTQMTDLDDTYYINRALAFGSGGTASLKSLYDSNNLRVFNRVGTNRHSRSHDEAQRQIASYASTTEEEAEGVFGQLIRSEPSSDATISLTGRRPNVFRGGRYINIGPSGAVLTNWYLPTVDRTAHFTAMKGTLTNRAYPDRSADLFKAAVRVDEIARVSQASGGPDGAGYGNTNNLRFLRTLLSQDVGKAFYMQADGGYDTHSDQLAPQSNFDPMNIPKDLNYNIGRVMSNLTTFFNDVKATQNITIVVFSEFGRTIEVNGDLGTDHGQGGGVFVMSNNQPLLTKLNQKVYGNLSIANAEENWLGVGIDYRSMYGEIYNSLYGVSATSHFGNTNSLSRDVSTNPARFALARSQFRTNGDWNVSVRQHFRVEWENFDSYKASHVRAERLKDPGSNTSPFETINTWEMHNYARKADNFYEIKRDWVGPERAYPLRMTAFTNQYTPTSLDPSILTPRIIRSNQATAVTGTGNLIFRRFDNLEVLPTGTALSGSGLILSTIAGSGSTGVTTIVGTGGVQVQTSSGTTAVTSVVSASGSIRWHGGYILGELIDPSVFVSEKATLSGASLSAMNIEKIARVGADTLGVGMRLSQNVTLSFPVNTVTPYRILSSEDGLNWSELAPSVTPVNGRVSFSTPHFSLFAAVSTVAPLPPSCTISASNTTPMNGTPITLSWSASNTQSISLAGFGAQMANGNLSVTPANDTGTTYTLSLVGAGNTSGSCQVTVTTQWLPPGNTGGSATGGGGGGSSGNSGGNSGAPIPGGGGGVSIGSVFTKDTCPTGDTSPSLYDGRCDIAGTVVSVGTPTPTSVSPMTPAPQMLSMESVLSGRSGFISSSTLSDEGKRALGSLVESYTQSAIVKSKWSDRKLVVEYSKITRKLALDIRKEKNVSKKAALTYVRWMISTQETTLRKTLSANRVVVPVISTRTVMPIEITPVETPPERRTPTVMPQKSPVVPATPIQIPESLFRYSDITFASYDWSQDRRLPRDISTIIDAQIEQLSRSYESAAGAPSLRYATTLWEIRRRAGSSTTVRDQKILAYLEQEFTILFEISKRPR